MSLIASSKARSLALPLACLLVWLFALLYAQTSPSLRADEAVHAPQILDFMHHRIVVNPYLTTIPGYHLLVAVIMNLLHLSSVASMRAINGVFGLLAALTFFAIRRQLGDEQAAWRSVRLFFLPLLFPYFFLIYTDVLSLVLVLGSLLATLRQRHGWAAIALIAAILVRQNNVAWAGLMPLLALWPLYQQTQRRPWLQWRQALAIGVPYLLPIGVFLAYWRWNGTISLSSVVAPGHPDLTLHSGNVYFTLLLFLLFFPYEAWLGIKRFIDVARAKPWLWLLPLLILINVKLRGSPDNSVEAGYFLRNALIQAVHHGLPRRAFAAAVAMAACGIAFTRFLLPQAWLIYPVSALYLSLSWLVENRYSIVPLALWMALRRSESEAAERCTTVVWLIVSMFFTWGIFGGHFML